MDSSLVKLIPFEVEFRTPEECAEEYRRRNPQDKEKKLYPFECPQAGRRGIVVGYVRGEYNAVSSWTHVQPGSVWERFLVIVPRETALWVSPLEIKPLGVWEGPRVP